MNGRTIRELRRRLGLTQRQLADKLNVDQGTISRWERGAESPRPERAAALRSMLMKDDDQRALARCLAIVRHDLMSAPVTFLDVRLRVAEMSRSAMAFMSNRGYDPKRLIGKDVDSWSERLAVPNFPRLLRESGVLTGEALLLRFVRNDSGHGHATVYEPIFAAGEFVGILNYVTSKFRFAANSASTLELVEVVPADNPTRLEVMYAGDRVDAALAALRSLDATDQ